MTDHDDDRRLEPENSESQPPQAHPTRVQQAEPRNPCADRTRVRVTNLLPYTLIGQLIVTFPSIPSSSRFEPVSYCTGILLDERHVLTAAHNLYNPRLGVWAYSVGFQAARDGSIEYYPSVAGSKEPSKVIPADVKELIVKYYSDGGDDLKAPPFDYCVLELSNVVIPQAEWLDISAPTDEELESISEPGSRRINITGYPDEMYPNRTGYPDDLHPAGIPFGTMWGQRGSLSGYSDSLLFYDICATGGQSGAPILMNLSGETHDWLVVGIHLFSERPSNVGLRFTDEIVRDIQRQAPNANIRSTQMTHYNNLKEEETMSDPNTPKPIMTIKWTDENGGLQVVKAVSDGATFIVEVSEPRQVSDWSIVFHEPAAASGPDPESPAATNGDHDLTIVLIQQALNFLALIALAGILAYAISRRYRITAKKTKTTWNFEFGPPQ